MLGFLLLHIAALITWCASLLYLPALIAGIHTEQIQILEPQHKYGSVARFVFTYIATPAALITIISGSAVFLFNRTIEVWLIAKLTLVTGLVITHALVGLVLLHTQDPSAKPVRRWCRMLNGFSGVLIVAIIWVVLAKPALEVMH